MERPGPISLGNTGIDLEFLETSGGEVLMRTETLEISCEYPDLPVEFAVEVPPLPLSHAGRYFFRLVADDTILGSTAVSVRALTNEG